jgi:hypothetical protein
MFAERREPREKYVRMNLMRYGGFETFVSA